MSSETDQLIDALAFWVCDDCMLARENDEWPSEDDISDDRPWPWLLFTEHEGPGKTPLNVTNWVTYSDITDEIVEGFEDFASSPCRGCGSTLGGSRWRYAAWPTHP